MDRYLRERHGLTVDLLEHNSTNCASNAVALPSATQLPQDRLILVRDATMQQRMNAAFGLLHGLGGPAHPSPRRAPSMIA